MASAARLAAVELDEASLARPHPLIATERAAAIRDLVSSETLFRPAGRDRGRFRLRLSRQETARASWNEFGAVIVVEDLTRDAPALADRIAAEHLEIATDDPEALFARIRNAGAAFLWRHTPEVIGDYVGGSNHVLPTARSARFSSGLSVLDFMKRTSILRTGPEQLRALAPAAIALAEAEGLGAHARSVAIRLNL